MDVPAGTYTLWTAPHKNGVDLIVNKQHGQWGTSYNHSLDLGTAKMITEVASIPVEAFTISIISNNNRNGKLVMEWGSFKWIAAIEVR